jgi:hypothetical protein
MPYILNKTNGTIVATVQDASLDLTTDLSFVGRNYAGYGEIQNENFLKLLENFANSTSPAKPIDGQIWYNSTTKKLNIYDGSNWKGVSNLQVSSESPDTLQNFEQGDLWFDTTEEQLHIYNGSSFILVGPLTGADSRAQWRGSYEYSKEEEGIPKYNIKAVVGSGNEVVAIVSADFYELSQDIVSPSFPIYPGTTVLKKGITLAGANPITGVSATTSSTGVLLWGTSAHSLVTEIADRALTVELNTSPTNNQEYSIPFSDNVLTYRNTAFTFNPSTNTVTADNFDGVASSALYADLAERYEADAVYDEGTVLVIGGEKEVTVTTEFADTRVAGVVSKKPAYLMNKDAGNDETHPAIALKGRVPCKVQGYVKKGDLIVTSSTPGYGIAASSVFGGAIIGKALGSQSEGFGIIEILVV